MRNNFLLERVAMHRHGYPRIGGSPSLAVLRWGSEGCGQWAQRGGLGIVGVFPAFKAP